MSSFYWQSDFADAFLASSKLPTTTTTFEGQDTNLHPLELRQGTIPWDMGILDSVVLQLKSVVHHLR